LGVADRPFAVHAVGFGHLGVVDEGVFERGPDVGAVDAAVLFGGYHLDVHAFLVVGAVVVDHVQERDFVMRGGPEDAGGIIQIAIGIDVYSQAAVFAIR